MASSSSSSSPKPSLRSHSSRPFSGSSSSSAPRPVEQELVSLRSSYGFLPVVAEAIEDASPSQSSLPSPECKIKLDPSAFPFLEKSEMPCYYVGPQIGMLACVKGKIIGKDKRVLFEGNFIRVNDGRESIQCHGEGTQYHSKDNLTVGNHKNGILHGLCTHIYVDKKYVGQYQGGVKVGVWELTDILGVVTGYKYHADGKKTKEWQRDEEGTLWYDFSSSKEDFGVPRQSVKSLDAINLQDDLEKYLSEKFHFEFFKNSFSLEAPTQVASERKETIRQILLSLNALIFPEQIANFAKIIDLLLGKLHLTTSLTDELLQGMEDLPELQAPKRTALRKALSYHTHMPLEAEAIDLSSLEFYLGHNANIDNLKQLFDEHSLEQWGDYQHNNEIKNDLIKNIIIRYLNNVEEKYIPNYFKLLVMAFDALGTNNTFARDLLLEIEMHSEPKIKLLKDHIQNYLTMLSAAIHNEVSAHTNIVQDLFGLIGEYVLNAQMPNGIKE